MKLGWHARLAATVMTVALGLLASAARAEEPEHRVKAAFVYNFIAYTEWSVDIGPTVNVCVHGTDAIGAEIEALHGKIANGRAIAVHRRAAGESLAVCHTVFLPASAQEQLPRMLAALKGRAVLTIADFAGAAGKGVVLNMNLAGGKVTFEANVQAARAMSLSLSSKLLRLATDVQQ